MSVLWGDHMANEEIAKAVYSYIKSNWHYSDNQLLFENQQADPSIETYTKIRCMHQIELPRIRGYNRHEVQMNFMLVTSNLDDLYFLNRKVDELRQLLEDRVLHISPWTIRFGEFDINYLDNQNQDNLNLQKIIMYCSIFCTVYITKT